MCKTVQDEKDRIYGKVLRIADEIYGREGMDHAIQQMATVVNIEDYWVEEEKADELLAEYHKECKLMEMWEDRLRSGWETEMIGALKIQGRGK